jgi:hypothetical protein
VFLVVADEAAGRSLSFVFLERVKEDFMQRYGSIIDNQSLADEDDFLLEDPFEVAYNLDRDFGYEKDTQCQLGQMFVFCRYHLVIWNNSVRFGFCHLVQAEVEASYAVLC